MDLIERTRMAAKILRDIGGQSAMAATVEEAAAAIDRALGKAGQEVGK
jgi:CMP-2-keto-3-deoxyoctulosonic acid synthetase